MESINDPKYEGCTLARNRGGQVCRILPDLTVRPVNSSELDRHPGQTAYKRLLEGWWPAALTVNRRYPPRVMRELGYTMTP